MPPSSLPSPSCPCSPCGPCSLSATAAVPRRPALFFDRDGVANASPGPGYVNRLADFRILPGFIDCVRAAADRGWPCVIVTNQRGVSRGLTPPTELDAMHDLLRRTLADRGLSLLDILVCIADDDTHPDRKPNPGLLLAAAARHNLDLSRSWMVGDREKDVETGWRAGVAVTVRLDDDGTGANPDKDTPSAATYRVSGIADCATLLRRRLPDLRARHSTFSIAPEKFLENPSPSRKMD